MAHALLWKRLGFVVASASPRKRLRLGLLLAPATVLLAACYTGPINMRPTISILGPEHFLRGAPMVTFTAVPGDPDNETVSVTWATRMGDCPTTDAQISLDARLLTFAVGMSDKTLVLRSQDTGAEFCVFALATDPHGATAIAVAHGDPINNPPQARITIIEPPEPASSYALNTTFKLSSGDSIDSDIPMPKKGDLRTKWEFLHAPIAKPTPVPCPGVEDDDRFFCFVATKDGPWVVRATVSDERMAADTVETASLMVLPGHAPTAELALLTPKKAVLYRLGTFFHVEGEAFDEDPEDVPRLIPDWGDSKVPPGAQLQSCPGTDSMLERCFTADVKGLYAIKLKISDGKLTSATQTMELEVLDDEPPCLGTTNQPITPEGLVPGVQDVIDFQVSVDDDLDPFPAPVGSAFSTLDHVRWLVKGPTDASFRQQRFGIENLFKLTKNPTYTFGDEVLVRVEVLDRDVQRSDRRFANCTGDQCVCPPDVCHLRPQPCYERTTWKVRYIQ